MAVDIVLSNQGIQFADGSVQSNAAAPQINAFTATVASNALTISEAALSLAFRSTTLGSGAVTMVTGTPANLIVPSTATLGTVSATQSRLVVLALNSAGAIELAVVNIAGGNDLTETGLISTIAISAAATAANVIYSNTARTSVAYRVIGYVESTQATAGTWATAPSTIQGVGGQALAAMSSLGYGQTWQIVTRTLTTNYYNTTARPILLAVTYTAATGTLVITVGGVAAAQGGGASGNYCQTVIVPPGAAYVMTTAGSCSISSVAELR